MLRPGGRWLILDFDRRATWTRVIAWSERVVGEPACFFTSDELVDMLEQIGFQASARAVSRAEFLAVARCWSDGVGADVRGTWVLINQVSPN